MENLRIKIRQEALVVPEEARTEVFETVQHWIETLPLFQELELDLQPLLVAARQFRTFQDVVVLGTGGSSLSGKMYAAFKASTPEGDSSEAASGPRLHFVDNVDPATWNRVVAPLNPQTTGVIAISKSGNTTETLCQTFMALDQWRGTSLSDHFLFVADPGESALREIGTYHAIPCLDHPIGIGGRFSGFSVVGLLPALIAGVDARELLAGAKETVQAFLEAGAKAAPNAVLDSAFFQAELFEQGVSQSVLFCYADRLKPFAEWYRQLWAESLGKHRPLTEEETEALEEFDEIEDPEEAEEMKELYERRFGMTPIVAMGTVDQHSQLQLYMDGPEDKFFTVLSVGDHPVTAPLDVKGITNPIAQALDGHTMAELMMAHQQVTLQTLAEEKPTRSIHIPKLDERSLGQLMMVSILETLALAALWKIDPFNQPGVKAGKDKVIALMRG